MNSDEEEVRSIIQALIPHIKSCKCLFKSRNISMSLYSLQNMSSTFPEVRELLRVMIPHK